MKQNNCLTKQSVSVVTSDGGKHLPDKGPSPYREMDTNYFAQHGIYILLKNIDQTKDIGPVELPARRLPRKLLVVLAVIF